MVFLAEATTLAAEASGVSASFVAEAEGASVSAIEGPTCEGAMMGRGALGAGSRVRAIDSEGDSPPGAGFAVSFQTPAPQMISASAPGTR